MNKYNVGETAITIYDSYKVKDDEEKKSILTEICLDVEGLELCRNFNSMLIEWKAHNILYKLGIIRSRTKDVDLEYNQNRFIAWCYKVVCFLFKE